MNIIIVGNGPWFECTDLLKRYDVIIAADGGANHCITANIKPTYVLGDFDSISDETKQKLGSVSEFVSQPDQNQTDLNKAIAFAETLTKEKFTIELACVTSNLRLDHTEAAIETLRTNPNITAIHGPDQIMYSISKEHVFNDYLNEPLSLIAHEKNTEVTLTGMQWSGELVELKLQSGMSNKITELPATVTVHQGSVLAIVRTESS